MSYFAKARAWLIGLPQPWRFVVYAIGFGLVVLLLTGGDLPRAALAGLLWATLISTWDVVRQRRRDG